jgi:hypothetical protein
MMAILTGVRWNLSVVLICISFLIVLFKKVQPKCRTTSCMMKSNKDTKEKRKKKKKIPSQSHSGI